MNLFIFIDFLTIFIEHLEILKPLKFSKIFNQFKSVIEMFEIKLQIFYIIRNISNFYVSMYSQRYQQTYEVEFSIHLFDDFMISFSISLTHSRLLSSLYYK